jgi:hypothetical protein
MNLKKPNFEFFEIICYSVLSLFTNRIGVTDARIVWNGFVLLSSVIFT